jgi:type I restriction enzyme S subunit
VIDDLNPYSETRDSGLPWLGDIPAHWEIKRNGSLFQQRNAVGEPDWPILEVSLRTGVRIREFGSTKRKQVMSDKAKYKCATKGDFVYNMMRMWQGAAGIAPVDGLVSPAYVVAKPLPHTNPAYFASLFRTDDYLAEIDAFSRGIVKDRNRLYWDQFKQIPTPCPPANEQAAIARFLAWATNRLDRAIGAKRRIIALLQEQKQAIIHRAVTRGLNPSVPLKDSGIPWLGEIPVHWEVLALKRVLSRLVDCEHKTAPFVQQSNYRVVRTSAVRNGLLRWSGTYCTSAKAFTEWTQRAVPEAGDVIFTREAPAGEACIIPEDARVCLGQRTVLMKPQRGIYDSQFLVHMIYAGPPRQLIELTCQGSTVSHFNMDDIGWMKILAPPLSEQIEIIAKVTELTEAPFLVIDKTEREITLLREYRTRLIADVVTGKLDVREMAKELPEEELQDQPDVEAVYDAGDSEEDPESDLIDTAED